MCYIDLALNFFTGLRMYPSGSRGSPAKGVVRETAARVQISPSAPKRREGFCPSRRFGFAFKCWRDLRVEVRAGASSLHAAEWREKSWNANKTADTRCFPGRAAKGANLAIRAKTETGNFTCLRFGFFMPFFRF